MPTIMELRGEIADGRPRRLLLLVAVVASANTTNSSVRTHCHLLRRLHCDLALLGILGELGDADSSKYSRTNGVVLHLLRAVISKLIHKQILLTL